MQKKLGHTKAENFKTNQLIVNALLVAVFLFIAAFCNFQSTVK